MLRFWKSHVQNRDTDRHLPKAYRFCRNDGEFKLVISRIVLSKVTSESTANGICNCNGNST